MNNLDDYYNELDEIWTYDDLLELQESSLEETIEEEEYA